MNSYICLELNAHGLLNLVLKCLDEKSFKYLLLWTFSSQACEGFYRNLRSMRSTFATEDNIKFLYNNELSLPEFPEKLDELKIGFFETIIQD